LAPIPNESHVHHYVPQAMLRRFAADPRQTSVFVFDKTSSRSWRGGIRSTGAQKGYNPLVRPDGTRLNFESDYDEIDADYAAVGAELTAQRSLTGLTEAFRSRLADVVAAQFLRTPVVRSTLAAVPRQLADQIRAMGFEGPSEAELPDEDNVRQSARELVEGRRRMRDALLAKDMILFAPAGGARFWTSDHPVARHSRHPLDERGFESQGVEIYLPIATDLLVGFLCPSLRHTGPLTEDVDGEARHLTMEALLSRGTPLRAADNVVNFFNALQVKASERFLFAQNDDFDLARQLIARDPGLATPTPLFRLGEAGMAPPRSGNLPPGEWLYLETGQGHLMIPIFDVRPGGRFEMSTDRTDLVVLAVALGRFVRAQVFADTGGGMLRDAEVEVIAAEGPTRIRVVPADPDMKALDAAIEDRRGG